MGVCAITWNRPRVVARLVFTLSLVVFFSLPARAATDGADTFIGRLAETAIASLTEKELGLEIRQERFRNLLRSGLNLGRMANVLLGPYRRRASDEEMTAFSAALEDYVVYTYAWRFANYSGERFETGAVRDGRRGSRIVESFLYLKDDPTPVRVDWHVEMVDGKWRIFDIIVESVSMVVTQKADFQSVLSGHGGSVEALTEILVKKNQRLSERIAETFAGN